MVKKGLTALGLLFRNQIILFEHFTENNFNFSDTLRDLIPFVQLKKREKHPSRIITFSNAWMYNNIGITSLFLSVKFLSYS